MNEQLIEYLRSPDKDTQLLGFEILNNLKLSKKEKVFILYSSGYKDKEGSNCFVFNSDKHNWYLYHKGIDGKRSFVPYYHTDLFSKMWVNKQTTNMPLMSMTSSIVPKIEIEGGRFTYSIPYGER